MKTTPKSPPCEEGDFLCESVSPSLWRNFVYPDRRGRCELGLALTAHTYSVLVSGQAPTTTKPKSGLRKEFETSPDCHGIMVFWSAPAEFIQNIDCFNAASTQLTHSTFVKTIQHLREPGFTQSRHRLRQNDENYT